MKELTKFDHYLSNDGPSALVLKHYLMPVEGIDGVLFPPTFAAGEDRSRFPGGYNIDSTAAGNVALIDSVGAQANRIEPIFKEEKYRHLVPQWVVKAGDKEVSILDASHRAGDALVRCSSLAERLREAFKAVQAGDAGPLAKIAPTSLVFGVWDSRDTQARLPRLIASTIRAFNVRKLTRSAQFNPAVDYAALKVFSEEDKATAEGDAKSPLAKRGFVHVPASGSHGGVIADGDVIRTATLGLAALRLLQSGDKPDATIKLRRYVLGLSLVALTHAPSGYLRQGCLLVLNPKKPGEFVEVHPNGDRKPCNITHEQAIEFATETAEAFKVEKGEVVPFEVARAKADLKSEADGKQAKKVKGKGKGTEVAQPATEVPE
jgi:CRISPR-associated protein Csb1